MTELVPRRTRRLVLEALADTRVVFVTGARQVGKSTLTREIVAGGHPATVVSFDEEGPREAARLDPVGFLEGFPGPVVIDEVQRVPGLLLAIKDRVDRDTRPGRFLLTGSANVFVSRRVREALTGRVETIVLWPLAQAEIRGAESNIIDLLFAGRAPDVQGAPVGRAAFVPIVAVGGYPEAMQRPAGRRRDRWFANYVQDTLDTDLRDISEALKLRELPRLLRLIASQAANELVYRNLARRLDLTHATVKSYVELLEIVFLARRLPAWRPGIGAREVRAPKGYIVDSGLLAHLLGADERRIGDDDQITGKMLENFVAMELLRVSEWADTDARLYHYRQGREEIDLILESRAGDIAAVEVKASATVRPRDYTAIAKLRGARGEHFKAGIVLYAGQQTVPLGDRIWAVPISGLWA
ncbi:MAG TPA: ATP-binding protein [Solirubrobacteraceae bacterium]|nr:ATP-binding protein [Solirubrobacteraceae bacterium]